MMGSGAFLLIYAAVSAGHLRIASKTGANRALLAIAVALCLGMFVLLAAYMYKHSKPSFVAMFVVLTASFVAELVYRKVSGRHLRTLSEGKGEREAAA